MFTNEFEHDEVIITSLDTTDNFEDVKIFLRDNYVCIQQYNDEDFEDSIVMSNQQWENILTALSLPEGVYKAGNK